jgi:hypothetical protein
MNRQSLIFKNLLAIVLVCLAIICIKWIAGQTYLLFLPYSKEIHHKLLEKCGAPDNAGSAKSIECGYFWQTQYGWVPENRR